MLSLVWHSIFFNKTMYFIYFIIIILLVLCSLLTQINSSAGFESQQTNINTLIPKTTKYSHYSSKHNIKITEDYNNNKTPKLKFNEFKQSNPVVKKTFRSILFVKNKNRISRDEKFEQPKSRQTRIVGGSKVLDGQLPWQAGIKLYWIFRCGGALIQKQWILTAAHCFDDFVLEPKVYHVILGSTTIHDDVIDKDDKYDVSDIVIHPGYDNKTYANDIALIKLSRPVNVSDPSIKMASLPDKEDEFIGQICHVGGWGAVSEKTKDTGSDVLRQVSVKVQTNEACRASLGKFYHRKFQICAGVTDGSKDTCSGDSGGALVCLKEKKNSNNNNTKNDMNNNKSDNNTENGSTDYNKYDNNSNQDKIIGYRNKSNNIYTIDDSKIDGSNNIKDLSNNVTYYNKNDQDQINYTKTDTKNDSIIVDNSKNDEGNNTKLDDVITDSKNVSHYYKNDTNRIDHNDTDSQNYDNDSDNDDYNDNDNNNDNNSDDNNDDYKYTIAGVVSLGVGCGRQGKFGLLTKVTSYLNWIDDIIYE